ncbi:MAG: hypothetical protein AAF391_00185 [Bacteroidota bacterium]
MTYYVSRAINIIAFLTLAFSCLVPNALAQSNAIPTDKPLKLCIVLDKSGSMPTTAFAQLQKHQLDILTSQITEYSGEVSVIAVREESNVPLIRYYVGSIVPPEMPELKGNAQQKRMLMNNYKKSALHYLMARRKRPAMYAEGLEAFNDAAYPVIESPANASRTDLWGAVHRCRNYLNESNLSWSIKPIKVMFLISDAVDTGGKPPIKDFPSDIHVFFVYNQVGAPFLKGIRYNQFEGIDEAIRELLALADLYEVSQ